MPGEQLSLNMRDEAERHGLPEKRMPKLVALALLPSDQHALSRLVGQAHAARLLDDEVARRKLAAVDQAERQTVGEHRPQLLHQIESETGAARPVGVEKTDLRVEPVRLEGRAAIMPEHRIEKGQQGVQPVQRGPTRTSAKTKFRIVDAHEMVEHAEIDQGRFPFYAAQDVHFGRNDGAAGGIGQPALGQRQRVASRRRHRFPVVAQGAAHDGALVGGLGGDDAPYDDGLARSVVGDAKLRPAQQHVPGARALDPREKAPVGLEVRHGHARFGAGGQQRRRCTRPAKADDAVQQVQRRAAAFGAIDLDHQIGAVLAQPRTLAGDVDRVQHAAHRTPSSVGDLRRQPAGDMRRLFQPSGLAEVFEGAAAAGRGAHRRRRAAGGDVRPRRGGGFGGQRAQARHRRRPV